MQVYVKFVVDLFKHISKMPFTTTTMYNVYQYIFIWGARYTQGTGRNNSLLRCCIRLVGNRTKGNPGVNIIPRNHRDNGIIST